MNQEEFLMKSAGHRLDAPKFKKLTQSQRERALEFCLTSWKQSAHRAEDAIRKMEAMAKKL